MTSSCHKHPFASSPHASNNSTRLHCGYKFGPDSHRQESLSIALLCHVPTSTPITTHSIPQPQAASCIWSRHRRLKFPSLLVSVCGFALKHGMDMQVSGPELSSLLSGHCTIENDVAFSAHSLKSNVSNPFARTDFIICGVPKKRLSSPIVHSLYFLQLYMDDMVSLLIFNNGEKKRCSLSLDNTWICSVWLWNSCLPDFRLLWTTEGGVYIYIRSSLEKYQIVIGTTPFSYTSNCMRAKKEKSLVWYNPATSQLFPINPYSFTLLQGTLKQ